MDDRDSFGSEAFHWLDHNMIAALDAPDEAFDWVFMLAPDDWILLEQVWPNRSSEWREACAYVIEGPVNPSQRLLRLALSDPHDDVATQAAVSICSQVLDHSDEIPFDVSLVPRLRELRRRNPGRGMEEVDEVLRRYDSTE